MDAAQAARKAAETLMVDGAAPGEWERAAQLVELAGDPSGARAATLEFARGLRRRAESAVARGEAGEAAFDFADAAQAFLEAGDETASRASARLGLEAWPQLAQAKGIEVSAAPATEPAPPKRLRRLPGGPRTEAGAAVLEPSEAAPRAPAVLPSMYVELHARLLRMAGRDGEARQAFEEALGQVAREVERRRQRQEWAEALSAASSLLRLALRAGGKVRLDQVRPDFVAVAREAAAEALTADYFAQGKQDIPAQAMEAAALEAHAMGNESFADKYEEEYALVLRRTAELLEALSDGEMAGQALLSWEGRWPVLNKRPDVRQQLLAGAPPFNSRVANELEGIAASHPLRREVDEFLGAKRELIARTKAAAPIAYARAARAYVGRNNAAALELAARGLALDAPQDGADASIALREAQRDAHLSGGDSAAAERANAELEAGLATLANPEERTLRAALARAELRAGGFGHAAPERAALANHFLGRALAALRKGDHVTVRPLLRAAVACGSPEAARWERVLDLAPDGWSGG